MLVAFDVDGCLLSKKEGYEDTPNYPVLETYCRHKAAGDTVIVWSGNGVDWARTWAMKLGLKHRFEAVAGDPICMEKPHLEDPNRIIPDITYDDEKVTFGRRNIQV